MNKPETLNKDITNLRTRQGIHTLRILSSLVSASVSPSSTSMSLMAIVFPPYSALCTTPKDLYIFIFILRHKGRMNKYDNIMVDIDKERAIAQRLNKIRSTMHEKMKHNR